MHESNEKINESNKKKLRILGGDPPAPPPPPIGALERRRFVVGGPVNVIEYFEDGRFCVVVFPVC